MTSLRSHNDPERKGRPGADAREVFDRGAETYEDAVDRSISFTGRNASFFAGRKVELLQRLLRSQGRDLDHATVLDVGCGIGTTDRHLAGQCKALHGVDISEEMLGIARTTIPNAEFSWYDGTSLPYPPGTFDIVLAICVLHHVPLSQRMEFIREVNRVTRGGGLIFIFEHNPANPLTRRAVRECALDDGAILESARHVHRLFAGAPARVVSRDYFLFTPFRGRIASTLDHALRWLPLGGQYVVMAEADRT